MRMRFLILVISALSVCLGQPEVETIYGRVSGRTRTLHTGISVDAYYGIPFAKPPVGDLRFRKPEEPEPWSETFVATRLPDACPQYPQGLIWITHPLWNRYDEDCLTINIFGPTDHDGGPYPVMVWFHGGGYTSSANIQYPGHYLAMKGVVVAVPNYRLGNLGFISTEDEASPGNYGLWDQHRALEFVRDNIAAFGGDPNQVTIFGQSAGGSSSGLHIVSPQSAGLFHQAIMESGTDEAAWAVNYPDQDPREYTRQVAAQVDCLREDSFEMIECMKELNFTTIREASITCKPGHFCQGMAPVVDGDFLPDTPWALRDRGEFADVPIINGHCKDDGSLYTIALVPESQEGGFNRSEFLRILKENLVDIFAPSFPDDVVEQLYEALNFYYTPWPYIDDEELNRDKFNEMITDFGWSVMGDRTMRATSEVADVFFYILGYRTTQADDIIPPWMGVPHNGELPYVLGWPMLQRDPLVRIDTGILIDLIPWDEEDIEWADYFLTMWTNFAKFGHPTPEPVPAPDGSETTWDTWSADDQQYLYLDRTIENTKDYRQKNIRFWDYHSFYLVGWRESEMPEGLQAHQDMKVAIPEGVPADLIQGRIQDFYHDLSLKALKRYMKDGHFHI